jgi:Domain of unknown function DUF11
LPRFSSKIDHFAAIGLCKPLALSWLAITAVSLGAPCWSAAPTIYSSAAYQSPVRADPDDLLLLAGHGFAGGDRVVYEALSDTTRSPGPPTSIPGGSTAESGIADVVSALDVPHSLTIHLPPALRSNHSYALWVVSPEGEWSNGVKINDARPLWITPDEVYAQAGSASLPRRIKVVGRNLQPAVNATKIRLSGAGKTYLLAATKGAAIDRYVAEATLPRTMAVGAYSVELSRDGTSWVPLIDRGHAALQRLRVLPDPATPAQFPAGDFSFGGCDPADARCPAIRSSCRADMDGDQTLCVSAAIRAAYDAGGGEVVFGPGEWKTLTPGNWPPGSVLSNKGVSLDGFLVPEGVSLRGASSGSTTLIRGAAWDLATPTFALQGRNSVTGFTFRDERRYQPGERGAALLSLGVRWDRVGLYRLTHLARVSHVIISGNTFDRPFIAIGSGGLAIDHLSVTKNIIGAFITGLFWEGNLDNPAYHYEFTDSIVDDNTFQPGSYIDTRIRSGTTATGLSGGSRIDFSGNVADGASTRYLYDAEHDAKGWRAAFFWAMHDNVEMMLVSDNKASCTGDKDGDGEAIAYDDNHNRSGFADLVRPVLASNVSAGSSTVTVPGSLSETQASYGGPVRVGSVADYYVGDWLQVVQGPGIGQARKISAISTESGAGGQAVTFTVSPAFDVLPQPGSVVTEGRLFWQIYTVGNEIDQRTPLCLKSNRTRRAGGLITQYAQTADSVIEGNRQFDTSGILIAHQFEPVDAEAGVSSPVSFVQSFTEIRDNLISGTYDSADASSLAEYGIAVVFAATPHTAPPPVLSYGLAISHNTVMHAGGSNGAIAFNPSWFTGPLSQALPGATPWKIADAALVFKNSLTNGGLPARARIGIGVSAASRTAPIEWRTVLYGNACGGTAPPSRPLIDAGTQTIRYCPAHQPDSCECRDAAAALDITTNAPAISAPVGGAVDVEVSVTNRGANKATGVLMAVDASDGVSIKSAQGGRARCDTADATVQQCFLGDIFPRETVAVTISASIDAPGAGQIYFSAGHRGADDGSGRTGTTVATEAKRITPK